MKIPHLNHEKLIMVAVWVGLIGTLSTLGRELPVQDVINPLTPGCDKSTHWDELDDDCKIPLLQNGEIPLATAGVGDLIISVIWGASYKDNHTPGSGGHPGVDIVSTAGTPIYAIYDGKVWFAGKKRGYGNTVTLKHTLPDGEVLYSSYNHLKDYDVAIGDTVREGQQIAEMGRTGNVQGKFGNHLDFQITKANSPAHPYGYHDCESGYTAAVQDGTCRELLEKYTVDPLLFLKKYGNLDITLLSQANTTEANTEANTTKSNTKSNDGLISLDDMQVKPVEEEEKDEDKDKDKDKKYVVVSDNSIGSLIKALRKDRTNQTSSIFQSLNEEYGKYLKKKVETAAEHTVAGSEEDEQSDPNTIKEENSQELPYQIDWKVNTDTLTVGKVQLVRFSIKNELGNEFDGRLDEKVRIEQEGADLTVAPSRFGRIVNGEKNIFLTPKEEGETTLSIYYDKTLLGTTKLTITK